MKIYFASDHAGFKMKNALMEFLAKFGYEIEDCGAYELDPQDDYPEFIKRAAGKVSADSENSRAIILGGSGAGEAIVANKFPNVRAIVFYGGSKDIITLSREHNDANVLALAVRFILIEEAKMAVQLWLETSFSGEERHKRRILAIEN